MKHKEFKEDLAQMAQQVEMDHEVQMARSDLYKAAKYSIKLHDMLKNISEQQGLEGWVQAKITKASDYLSSVYHYMEYEMMSQNESSEKKRLTYLDEGVLDFFKKGAGKIKDYAKSLYDPATAAKLKQDDQTQIGADIMAKDIYVLAANQGIDLSKGVPVELIGGYLEKYVKGSQDHGPKFTRKEVQQWLSKEVNVPGKMIPKNQLAAWFKPLVFALNKVEMPQAQQQTKPQAQQQTKPQAQQQPKTSTILGPDGQPMKMAASLDYKQQLAQKLNNSIQQEAEKQKGVDGKVCWKGYKRMGTKMKGGKRVDNCVPIKKK